MSNVIDSTKKYDADSIFLCTLGTNGMNNNLDMKFNTVKNVRNPVLPSDAATKEYVDNLFNKLSKQYINGNI